MKHLNLGRKGPDGSPQIKPMLIRLPKSSSLSERIGLSRPEFIRLPKPGLLCRHSGLSRSKMNELILANKFNNFKPPVRSFCLRNRGQQRGVRLIVFDSLMEYLRGFLEEAEQMKPVDPLGIVEGQMQLKGIHENC
jgi:hypothetical protein